MAAFLSGECIKADLTSIATIALVLVTAIAFYCQSRQNRFALGIELLLKLDGRFNMMRASRQNAATYLKEKQGIRTGIDISIKDLERDLDEVLDFFDQLGYFLKRSALERRAVWSAFYDQVHHWYCNAEKYITPQRQLDATIWENFEYLDKQLVAEQMRHKRNNLDPSIKLGKEDLLNFLNNESGSKNPSKLRNESPAVKKVGVPEST
jgi:hypothetical protein